MLSINHRAGMISSLSLPPLDSGSDSSFSAILTSSTFCSEESSSSQTDCSPVHSPSKEKADLFENRLECSLDFNQGGDQTTSYSPSRFKRAVHHVASSEDTGYESGLEDSPTRECGFDVLRKIRNRRGTTSSLGDCPLNRPTLESHASERTITQSNARTWPESGTEPSTPISPRFSNFGLVLPTRLAQTDEQNKENSEPYLSQTIKGRSTMADQPSLPSAADSTPSPLATNFETKCITPSKLRERRPAVAHIPISLRIVSPSAFDFPSAVVVATNPDMTNQHISCFTPDRPDDHQAASQPLLWPTREPQQRQLSNILESPSASVVVPCIGGQRSVSGPAPDLNVWSVVDSSLGIRASERLDVNCPPTPILLPVLGADTPSPIDWISPSADFFGSICPTQAVSPRTEGLSSSGDSSLSPSHSCALSSMTQVSAGPLGNVSVGKRVRSGSSPSKYASVAGRIRSKIRKAISVLIL